MDKSIYNKNTSDLTRWLSIQFYGETEEKQKELIANILNIDDGHNSKAALIEAVIKYFSSLVDDTIEPENCVLMGFSYLAISLPSKKYYLIMTKYLGQSNTIFLNYDHPLKPAFKIFLQSLAINSKKNKNLEKFWKSLWSSNSDYWHEVSLFGLRYQNVRSFAKELPEIYSRFTYNSDKILKNFCNDYDLLDACCAVLKNGINNKDIWAERLCSTMHGLILDKDDKDSFVEMTGFKPYSSYSYYSNNTYNINK